MVEATENIDLVTMRRQSDLDASQRAYQEQESALPQQTSQTLVIPAETTVAESQVPVQPLPLAPAVSPLTALRFSLVAAVLLGLLLLALRQRRNR